MLSDPSQRKVYDALARDVRSRYLRQHMGEWVGANPGALQARVCRGRPSLRGTGICSDASDDDGGQAVLFLRADYTLTVLMLKCASLVFFSWGLAEAQGPLAVPTSAGRRSQACNLTPPPTVSVAACRVGAKPGAPLGGEEELLRQLAQQGLQCDPTTQVCTGAQDPGHATGHCRHALTCVDLLYSMLMPTHQYASVETKIHSQPPAFSTILQCLFYCRT